MPLYIHAQLRTVTQSHFGWEPFYVKISTFFLARTIKSLVKWILDSERTFKVKVRFHWTVFEILLMSAIICIQRVWHGNEIVQYLQNYDRHESGKGHSRRPLQSSKSYIQIENTKTIRLLFKGSWILSYFWHSNCKATPFRKPTEVSQNTSTYQ